MLGVLVCEECTELLFHYVGPPHGEMYDASADLKAISLLIQALPLPTLTDEAGTSYEPVSRQPISTYGTGGPPDPERPRVITGRWRYTPAAPTATTFTATLDKTHATTLL